MFSGRDRASNGTPSANDAVAMTRILVVEDDANLRPLLHHILWDGGYQVDVTDCVASANALLESRDYDLVLADGRLPDGTGMMVARTADEKGVSTLIITGYAFDLPREEIRRYEYLLKPVRIGELLAAIERALNPQTG